MEPRTDPAGPFEAPSLPQGPEGPDAPPGPLRSAPNRGDLVSQNPLMEAHLKRLRLPTTGLVNGLLEAREALTEE